MKLRTTRELGVLIGTARRQAGLTQAQVAGQMRATQKWVSAVENGKDTAEIGQVLRLLALLGIDITVATMPRHASRKPPQTDATRRAGAGTISPPSAPALQPQDAGIDLDLLLNGMKGDEPR